MPSASAQVAGRDLTIDIVRGLGILMIGVDHLAYLAEKIGPPDFVNPFMTWLRIGWSSAAEFFVFFSGYVVGLVYLKTLDQHGVVITWARAGQRAWRVYILNVVTLCMVLLLLHLGPFWSPRLAEVSQVQAFMGASAATAFVDFLQMRFAAMFFEILHLYVVLLLLVPLILLAAKASGVLLLLASLGLWFTVQLNEAYGIAPVLASQSNFNPLGWQLLFILGMLASINKVFERLARAVPRRRLLVVSGSLLLLALFLKGADRMNIALPLIGTFDMPGYDKANLGPLQLIHFLVSVVFVMQAMPRSESLKQSLPFRTVARVGARSLECFCLSTILVYAALGRLAQIDALGPVAVFSAGLVIVVLLCAFAPFMDWIDAKPWRGPRSPERSTRPVDLPRELRTGESR